MKLHELVNHVFQVDAFTSTPFKGNPAGVVVLKDLSDSDFMQKMASEMNLSETAFVAESKGELHIRFFTPYSEIPLCGHATLATAHVFYENHVAELGEAIVFKTVRHNLVIQGDKQGIHMQFPTYEIKQVDAIKEFCEITGLAAPLQLYKSAHGWYMAHYADSTDVVKVHPHLQHMKHTDFGHLIVTAHGEKKDAYDYVSRCFVPALGIDEDPVTGSAQCVLAPFWSGKLHKTEMVSFQASLRTGTMHVKVLGDEKIEISGNAITVFEGKLKI